MVLGPTRVPRINLRSFSNSPTLAEAGLFCGNSELDELRDRELLVRKHESHHLVSEAGSWFARWLIGCPPRLTIRRSGTCPRRESHCRGGCQYGRFHPSPTTPKSELILVKRRGHGPHFLSPQRVFLRFDRHRIRPAKSTPATSSL